MHNKRVYPHSSTMAYATGGMPAVGLIERVLAAGCSLWVDALAVNLIIQSRKNSSAERPGANGATDRLEPSSDAD